MRIPWDHDQLAEPIHVDSEGNQEQPVKDLCMHSALHYAFSGYASAANKTKKKKNKQRSLLFYTHYGRQQLHIKQQAFY